MTDLDLALRYCHYIDLMGSVKDLINSNVCLEELISLREIHDKLDNLREMFQKSENELKKLLKKR